MTFELTVVLMNTRDNLNNIWNFSLNATFSPFKWFIVNMFYLLWAILSKVIFFTLKRSFINLFMSTCTCVFVYWSGNLWILKFYFVCCKAFCGLIKTKWYSIERVGFLLSFYGIKFLGNSNYKFRRAKIFTVLARSLWPLNLPLS